MINIRPVSDLRNNFTEIESLVKEGEAVYLTKNGYGTMVVLGIEEYCALTDQVERKLDEADQAAAASTVRYTDDEDGYHEIKEIYACSHLDVTGIFSHFSVSDELDENNLAYSMHQKQLFDECIQRLKNDGIEVGKTHLQNSYGVLNFKFDYDYVRPGLLMLGVTSDDAIQINSNPDFIPALSLHANISYVKHVKKGANISYGRHHVCETDTKIATCSIGYADGLPRNASNKHMEVLVHGKRCPIIGNICMDQCMVDVSEVEDVCEGEVATFIGAQGNEKIKIDEWSRCAGTINNEMLCRFSVRVPRFYTQMK